MQLRDEALRAKETNKLKYYKPYDYQKKFHGEGLNNPQRLLMAANRIGKTESGAAEMAFHLTGMYPSWWEGRRFPRAIKAWAAGINNDKTRDILQAKLLGPPGNPDGMGTGYIPKSTIGETMRKPGVPNALQMVYIKHVSGKWSQLALKSYEMGAVGFMGESVDLLWLDEEPSQTIYTQCITRTADVGGSLYMTFTPESGMTDVVAQFMNDLKPGQSLVMAGWGDVSEDKGGHLTHAVMEQLLAAYPPHERDMRTKGIPMLGSGLVYPIPEADITCEPFKIPDYYPRVFGLDFGWDHPTALACLAWDRDTDVVYIYDVYRSSNAVPAIHAAAVVSKGQYPVMWPHDGNRADSYGGPTIAQQYRSLGVKMHYTHFTNPPAPGQKEGQGGNSVEPGVMEILTRMQTGRFKVFKHLNDWFEEFRMYHRKDGLIVPKGDDLMAATRYAVMSLRFARTQETKQRAAMAETEFNPYGD